MIYYRRYMEAFGRHTSACSMLQRGAYSDLLDHYYLKELPLPLNSDELARICRAITLEERAAIDAVLDRFFIRRADGWHNERADHEIAVSKTARANGSRGGRPSEQESDDETGSETGSKTGSQTGKETGVGGGSGHPFSLSTKTILSTSQPLNQLPSDDAPRRGRKAPSETGPTWEAYRASHLERYGVEPVRNARVNGQLASVVRSVGAEAAPAIAAFYVKHNRAAYVQAKHSTSLLARDAEGLHTEWTTGQRVSESEARQADSTLARGNAFGTLIDEARTREALPR